MYIGAHVSAAGGIENAVERAVEIGAEAIAVVSLDGRTIGDGTPGPITRDLLARFATLTRGK